jgi:transposase
VIANPSHWGNFVIVDSAGAAGARQPALRGEQVPPLRAAAQPHLPGDGRHYGSAALSARANRPRDKAKAEVGVQIAERWILATLRNERFTSLAEANAAIAGKLAWLNNRPFSKLEGTRALLFEALDALAMRPLPADRYEFATWKTAKVNIDYHIDHERSYYSVPHQLVGHHVDVRAAEHTVEMFFSGDRVASHRRSHIKGSFSTQDAHMPEGHRAHRAWTPQRLVDWAARTGPATAELVEAIMDGRPHPEQGYRSCLGIMRLSGRYESHRMEAACRRTLAIGARSYRSVESILAHGLDAVPLPGNQPPSPLAGARPAPRRRLLPITPGRDTHVDQSHAGEAA